MQGPNLVPVEASSSPTPYFLGGLGVFTAAIYLVILALSHQFHYGEGYEDRPLLTVVTLFSLASVLYLVTMSKVIRRRTSTSRDNVAIIVGFGLVFRGILLFSSPIQEVDYYRYLWDGQVTSHGLNPYRYAPAEIERDGAHADSTSDLHRTWELTQRSASIRTIFTRVHHRDVPTIYPPAAQAVFALSAWLTPPSASLWTHLVILKVLILGFDLGTLLVLISLLRRLGMPAAWCVAYAWCPLAIKEISNSVHLDAIAVFWTVLTLRLLIAIPVRVGSTATTTRLSALTGLCLACGVLAKSYPIVLVPVIGAYLISLLRWRAVYAALAFAGIMVAGYAPFLSFAPTATTGEHTPVSGLGTFLGRWEMNDFLFMLTYENLRPPRGQPEHWFVVVPAPWRESLTDVLPWRAASPAGCEPAFALTQGLLGLLLLALTLWWAKEVFCHPEPGKLLGGCFRTLAWGWLLSSAPNPWYVLWWLPFMVFEPRRSWWLLTGLVFLYYVRFAMAYRALSSVESLTAARAAFDFGVVWLEYVPFFLALLVETCRQRQVRVAAD